MIFVFTVLAFIALVSFLIHTIRRDGHWMAYSAAMCIVWSLASIWWSGGFGF